MADKKKIDVESKEVLQFFPTTLWKTQLKPEDYERMNGDIKKSLDRFFAGKPRPMPGQHLQTEQKLHQLEEFKEFTDFIRSATEDVLDYLHVVYDSFEITGCWANIGAVNASHDVHSHPNNFLSGVYYVQTQKGANTIKFEDPRSQVYIMLPDLKKFTAENTRSITLDVKEGMLLIFPAWFLHSVDRNQSDKERISISFNIMFSSYAETMCAPKWKWDIDAGPDKA